MRRAFVLVVLVAALLIPANALAWSGAGHRLTGRIAYRHLTPESRAQIDLLLRHHPRFEQDLLMAMPENFGDSMTWAFMNACVWPDVVRNRNHPLNARYGRAPWHYITLPFVPEGIEADDLDLPASPVFHWEPGTEADNAVTGMQQAVSEMQNADLSWEERAVALSFFLHLAGDIHQPLHATTRFCERFPAGDRGGNEIMITHDGRAMNLHFFWDQLPGRFVGTRELERMTIELERRFPRRALAQAGNLDFATWALESHRLGVEAAHRRGEIEGVVRSEWNGDQSIPPPELAGEYVDASRDIALERVALAGYRMAAVLNAIFGEGDLEPAPFQPLPDDKPPANGELLD